MATLNIMYLPVPDLTAALAFYRDTLGWEEGWREGDATATVKFPGGSVQLMLDVDTDGTARPGPMLIVDDCRAWLAERDGTVRTVVEVASQGSVAQQHDSGPERLTLDEAQLGHARCAIEQTLTPTEYDGENEQAVLVHELGGDQGGHQRQAAGHDDVPTLGPFERLHLTRHRVS